MGGARSHTCGRTDGVAMQDQDQWSTIDMTTVLGRFKAQWQEQAVEKLAALLPSSESSSFLSTLEQLICLDLKLAWQNTKVGKVRPLEEYFAAFPFLTDEARRRLVVGEHRILCAHQKSPRIEMYLLRFPGLFESRDSIGTLIETHSDVLAETLDESKPLRPQAPTVGKADFGDYEILDVIARGGMGVVYRARQKRLNRVVALKMILSGVHASETDVMRFRREAEAAAALDHPGIVPVFDVGEHDGRHYLSMGYVAGQSLAKRLQDGPMPPVEAARIALEVADALSCAHEHSIVHRDLKPANVLIDESGRSRVTDFGLAKTVEADGDLTASGQVLGTPSYMPPEQAAGKVDLVGPASDIYSLGAMFYACLVGRPPFQAASVIDTLNQVIHDPPISPRRLNPRIPQDAATICLKCLEKSPADRYGSAQEVGEDLQRFIHGEPIHARPTSLGGRVLRWGRRRPVTAGLVLAACCALVATVMAIKMSSRAAEARQIGRLQTQVERQLADPRLDASYLEELDQTIQQLAVEEEAVANEYRFRLTQQYATAIRAALRGASLSSEEQTSIAEAIDRLEKRDPFEADSLRMQLAERTSQWREVFQWAEPFDRSTVPEGFDLVSSFNHESKLQRSALTRKKFDSAWIVLADAPESFAELDATFAWGWKQHSEVGIGLVTLASSNASDPTPQTQDGVLSIEFADDKRPPHQVIDGYQLLLRPAISGKFKPKTLSESLQLLGEVRLDLTEGGRVLQSVRVPEDRLKESTLRLRLRRERLQWTLQINQGDPWIFHDLVASQPVSVGFGILWPIGCGLQSVLGMVRTPPAVPVPLEAGDEAFLEGDFASALSHYRIAERQFADSSDLPEVQLKIAVCLIELHQKSEGIELLRRVMGTQVAPWSQRAACQLWLTLVRERQREEAATLIASFQGSVGFRDFATLIPVQERNEILQFYTRPWDRMDFHPSPEHVSQLQAVLEVQRLLGATLDEELNTEYHLLEVLLFHGHLQDAEQRMLRWLDAPYCSQWERFQFIDSLIGIYLQQGGMDAESRSLSLVNRSYRGQTDSERVLLLTHRARIHAHFGRFSEAKRDIERVFDTLDHQQINQPLAWLLYGLILQQDDDPRKAREIWNRGGELVQSHPADPWMIMLYGLSTNVDPARARQILRSFYSGGQSGASGGLLDRMVQESLPIELLMFAMVDVWKTPRGSDCVRRFVFFQEQRGQLIPRTAQVIAYGVMQFIVLDKEVQLGMDQDHDEGLWQLTLDMYQAYLRKEISQLDGLAVYGAWLGHTQLMGWKMIEQRWPPVLRGPLAYVFSHRFARLNQTAEALALTRLAIEEVPAEHPLHNAIEHEQRLIAQKWPESVKDGPLIRDQPIKWQFAFQADETPGAALDTGNLENLSWTPEPPRIPTDRSSDPSRRATGRWLARSQLTGPDRVQAAIPIEIQCRWPMRVFWEGKLICTWSPPQPIDSRVRPSFDNGGLWNDHPPAPPDRLITRIPSSRWRVDGTLMIEIQVPSSNELGRIQGWYSPDRSLPLDALLRSVDPKLRHYGRYLYGCLDDKTAEDVRSSLRPQLDQVAPQQLWFLEGIREWSRGNLQQAEQALRTTIDRQGESEQVMRAYATVLREQEKWSESVEVLSWLTKRRADDGHLWSVLSDSARRVDSLPIQIAIDAAASSMRLAPNSPQGFVASAIAKMRAGQPTTAYRELKRARELGADGPELEHLFELLRSQLNVDEASGVTR